jgi:F-box/TPR repeat protein Pof3
MLPEEYQEIGRSYYKLKQYEKALETFSKGIETCPTADLYDHRAATYEKLGNFNAAVKDGRGMIRLNKKDVKGYLRTASVLEKMEKHDTALGIYKYGMKNVPVGDKNFKVGDVFHFSLFEPFRYQATITLEYLRNTQLPCQSLIDELLFTAFHLDWIADYYQLLQQLHDRLTRKLSPASAFDPLTVLPAELAEMVLEYCSFRHMVNCMRVSRGWRDYLSKLSKLWMHLDLSGARRPVPRSFINAAFKRSEFRMTRVTVHRFEHINVIRDLVAAAKDLSELELISLPHVLDAMLVDIVKSAPKLKKFTIKEEIPQNTAVEILHARPALELVSFGALNSKQMAPTWAASFGNLRTLSINWPASKNAASFGLTRLLSRTPCLESLSLSQILDLDSPWGWPIEVTQLPPLKSLVLKTVIIEELPLVPPTLQRLVVENVSGRWNLSNDRTMDRCCVPELTHLTLSGFSGLDLNALSRLLDVCTHNSETQTCLPGKPLQSLSLRGLLNPNYTRMYIPRTPKSILGQSPRILTPALEFLDIATMPCDDDTIEELLTHKTGLQTIDISHTKISGASIKMLADKLPTLKRIKANNCTKINGRDAIHYAERKGISVSCQMLEQEGGRRIRYG